MDELSKCKLDKTPLKKQVTPSDNLKDEVGCNMDKLKEELKLK
jgi:hypothetical protein